MCWKHRGSAATDSHHWSAAMRINRTIRRMTQLLSAVHWMSSFKQVTSFLYVVKLILIYISTYLCEVSTLLYCIIKQHHTSKSSEFQHGFVEAVDNHSSADTHCNSTIASVILVLYISSINNKLIISDWYFRQHMAKCLFLLPHENSSQRSNSWIECSHATTDWQFVVNVVMVSM